MSDIYPLFFLEDLLCFERSPISVCAFSSDTLEAYNLSKKLVAVWQIVKTELDAVQIQRSRSVNGPASCPFLRMARISGRATASLYEAVQRRFLSLSSFSGLPSTSSSLLGFFPAV